MPQKVMTADQVLTILTTENDAAVEAYRLTAIFANAATRAQLKTQPSLNPGDAFYGRWTAQMGNLGWKISLGATTRAMVSPSGAGRGAAITLGHFLLPLVQNTKALTSLLSVMQASPLTPDMVGLLDFWWDSVTVTEGTLLLGTGSVEDGDATSSDTAGSMKIQMDFASIATDSLIQHNHGLLSRPAKLDTTSWRCLFTLINPPDALPTVRSVTAQASLSMIKTKEIQLQLAGKDAEHYRVARLEAA